MQPIGTAEKRYHDPAPSRASYRIQRLWLTPFIRAFTYFGLPLLAVAAAILWYGSDDARVDNLRTNITELRASIENRPEFMVNLMRIEDVSAEVAEDIREITAIDYPISSFELDLTEMRARIEELDAVAEAGLVVRAGVLDVVVLERVGKVVWRGREALELLDDGGHRVSAMSARQEYPDLPLIAGDAADLAVPEAMELFRISAPIADRVRGLLRVGERRWDLILDRNQRIMLPEIGAVAALERVLAMNEMNGLLALDLVAVDLRDGRRPTLRLSGDAMRNLRLENGQGAEFKEQTTTGDGSL
ncbi:MAG: cell division protein FtsQ [Alphaproteobacteria bacterium]|nr:cell division protein FtsQ [Alphaproteobacteria bacterium]